MVTARIATEASPEGVQLALGGIADPKAAYLWRGGSSGRGRLALKETAGPRIASPGGGQLTLGWGV